MGLVARVILRALFPDGRNLTLAVSVWFAIVWAAQAIPFFHSYSALKVDSAGGWLFFAATIAIAYPVYRAISTWLGLQPGGKRYRNSTEIVEPDRPSSPRPVRPAVPPGFEADSPPILRNTGTESTAGQDDPVEVNRNHADQAAADHRTAGCETGAPFPGTMRAERFGADKTVLVAAAVARAEQLLARGDFPSATLELRAARGIPGYEHHPRFSDLWRQVGCRGQRTSLLGGWRSPLETSAVEGAERVTLTANRRHALVTRTDKVKQVWDLAGEQPVRSFQAEWPRFSRVALTPGSRFALTSMSFIERLPTRSELKRAGAQAPDLQLWEIDTGRIVRAFESHAELVTHGTIFIGDAMPVQLTPDGRFAVSGGDDMRLRLWDVQTGRCLRAFEGHRHDIVELALTADGCFALSGSRDLTLRLWELATGRLVRGFAGHGRPIKSVMITADDRYALSVGEQALRIWELDTGRCIRRLEVTADSAALTPDGRFVLTAGSGEHALLQVWDLNSGECVRRFEAGWLTFPRVALSADASRAFLTGYPVRSIAASNVALSADASRAFLREPVSLQAWELDWDYDLPAAADWDDGARPFLETFLTLRTPYESSETIVRRGRPRWSDDEYRDLLRRLQEVGYGWLRPAGVHAALERMAAVWEGPPDAPSGPVWANTEDVEPQPEAQPARGPQVWSIGTESPGFAEPTVSYWCQDHQLVIDHRAAGCTTSGPFPSALRAELFGVLGSDSSQPPLPQYDQSVCVQPAFGRIACPQCGAEIPDRNRVCRSCKALTVPISHACGHDDMHITNPRNGAIWLMSKVLSGKPCHRCQKPD